MFGNRILLLIPHPDDEVVGCCAAVCRAVAAGAVVFGFYLTNGVPARDVMWPWQRARHGLRIARRSSECARAADLLGLADAGRQDVPSRELRHHLASTERRLERILNETAAEVMWVPAYEGGHQDHDVANFLAHRFADRLPVWEFSEYNYGGGRVRSQEFWNSDGNEKLLSLSDGEARMKRLALAIYRSERGNLGGIETGRESFRPLPVYDYGRPPHDGPLFYQRFQWVLFRHPRIDFCTPQEVCRAIQDFLAAPALRAGSGPHALSLGLSNPEDASLSPHP